jgi:hypothetical protein
MNKPAFAPCLYCLHAPHGTEKCVSCKCKGKPGIWRGFLNALGNAIGQAKFGGD